MKNYTPTRRTENAFGNSTTGFCGYNLIIILYKSVLVEYWICISIKNRTREPGRDVKILSDRMLRTKDSAEHFRWTCVDRPSCSVDEKLHDNAPHRKCLRKLNHRVLRIEPNINTVQKCASRILNLHLDKKSYARTGARCEDSLWQNAAHKRFCWTFPLDMCR